VDGRKRKKLEAAGFRVGSVEEFLDLTPEEAALIDLKLSLGTLVRAVRKRAKLSQHALAGRLHSSQSRVAKLEAGDASVSLDLIVKAAFAAGAKKSDLAKAIATRKRAAVG
jgi:ribosome-binding protein aMBF1 (putative translation factor)